MRYTRREKALLSVDIDGTEHWNEYISVSDRTLADEKLCQLEDIEEKIGIDLITLFTSALDGFYAKDENGRITFIQKTDVKEKLLYFKEHLFKEYGITWALTKEELL